jgi:integrase
MPAAVGTVREYVAWLADEGRTLSTITAYLAAIASAHSIAKHPFDRSALKDDLKGIRRVHARKPRQAFALVGIAKDPRGLDLRGILSGLGSSAIDARDRLLLALGFAAALRRSELVGLDWKRQGTGEGYLTQDHRGIVITLLSTKGGKGEPVEVIVPCADMPTACDALDEWAAIAKLEPGQPVFREVIKGGHIGAGRLSDRSVARIIKRRVRERALELGRSEADADELADMCSGHSLRAGFCTAAAIAGKPEWKIRSRSRHKTAELVARYVRTAEEWTESGLKGVGF